MIPCLSRAFFLATIAAGRRLGEPDQGTRSERLDPHERRTVEHDEELDVPPGDAPRAARRRTDLSQ